MAVEVMRSSASVVSRISASGTSRPAIRRVFSRTTALITVPSDVEMHRKEPAAVRGASFETGM
jgi:hypothetical protein